MRRTPEVTHVAQFRIPAERSGYWFDEFLEQQGSSGSRFSPLEPGKVENLEHLKWQSVIFEEPDGQEYVLRIEDAKDRLPHSDEIHSIGCEVMVFNDKGRIVIAATIASDGRVLLLSDPTNEPILMSGINSLPKPGGDYRRYRPNRALPILLAMGLAACTYVLADMMIYASEIRNSLINRQTEISPNERVGETYRTRLNGVLQEEFANKE